MPVAPTFPGIYIEEVPSGVRTITGVSTSVTAFVGFTPRGPVNKATTILDFGAFERIFGGLDADSEISYGVRQFFFNGGSEAVVVRVAAGAAKAAITLRSDPGAAGLKTLVVTAASEGSFGNNLRVDVDYATTIPDSTFNLSVTELVLQGTDLVPGVVEVHRNLSMDSSSPQYAVNVVNAASQLVTVARSTDVTNAVLQGLAPGTSLSGDDTGAVAGLSDSKRSIAIVVDGDGPHQVPIFAAGATPPADLTALATQLQAAIRLVNPGVPRFSGLTVQRANALGTAAGTGNFLLITSGTPADPSREHSAVHVLPAGANDASQLLKLGVANGGREREAAADLRPSQTGTTSGDLPDLNLGALNVAHQVKIEVQDGSAAPPSGTFVLGSAVTTLPELAATLQAKIRALSTTDPALTRATVQPVGTRLRVVSGSARTDATVVFTNVGGGTLVNDLKLNVAGGSKVNVQRYSLGVGANAAAQTDPQPGSNGAPPPPTLLTGALATKTGMYALEDADIFNLLCIPAMAALPDTQALALIAEAATYCGGRRAFLLVDPPANRVDVAAISDWMTNHLTPDKNAALYFPSVMAADPLDGNRLAALPPSGTIAGLCARIDATRGVWKAPAGVEATLSNVQALRVALTDRENGQLNPLGINCLRTFPVFGRVCWGARTLVGSDQQASEWKYVPVRRIALFIEESLYRGTKWVVFEPNDEPLWAQIRLNVGAFMHNLFVQGAFQGRTPREAYFVKCDNQTTTQNDIDLGVVNILVGFAPLKPAEFVIIKIQQKSPEPQV